VIRDLGDTTPGQQPSEPKNASAASRGGRSNDAADEHQMWLVSTRQLPSASRDAPGPPLVQRYQARSGWSESSVDDLLAAEKPSAATCVLVHGNHTDRQLAISKGFEVYRTLVRGAKNGQPVRLIVWSWPSDQIPGSFREDARIKARRTNIEAYYLARFLDRLRGENPVSLVGYSFGARVITGSLHLLGGGALANRRLSPQADSPRPPFYAVLLAAAVDRQWLLEGRPHGRALSAVERMVVLVNPQDRVLRWYRFVSPGAGSEALGSKGLPSSLRSKFDREKLVQVNVANAVGNRHGWTNYLGSNEIVKRLQQETLVETTRRNGGRAQAGGG
jgi:pimeloyl-ACP methyl ester carboxylesterase